MSPRSEYETFRLITHNVTDFPAKTTGSHTTISQIFLTAAALYSLTPQALPSRLLDLEEFHYENSFAWEDETRGLGNHVCDGRVVR
jgi:hypothetical protein